MSPRAFDRFMVDVEIGRNLKLGRMTLQERWVFVAGVLPIAAKSPIRGLLLVGELPALSADIARQADASHRTTTSALRKLRDLGILETDSEHDCERVHDFEDWNPPPKTDKTAALRAKRYRDRLASRRDGAVTNAVTGRDVTRSDRDDHADEGEGEVEDPPTPLRGNVVTFGKRTVPSARLALAESLLTYFNEKASTSYGPFTGTGKPSESLKRILGRLTEAPDVDEDEARRIIDRRFAKPFWDGKPSVGVVFGPGVFDVNRENAADSVQPTDLQAWL